MNSLIDRLPQGRRTEFLVRLSQNGCKRIPPSLANRGKPTPVDAPFARAPRAWVGRLAWLGIFIEEIYPAVGPNTMTFGFPTAAIADVTVDPAVGAALPANFVAQKDGTTSLLDYTGSTGLGTTVVVDGLDLVNANVKGANRLALV